ncbi:MFS transporter [Actinocorallia populi]|uniref:hypothetical protein n=1 Tax=Actinocorallia populi TaxID=2079200 RepID=UPI000D08ED4F|nr:hypothetical protein [Actinocorallia populi]
MNPAPSRSQRAFTVIGFLAAAGLTAGAFVLSYDALRLLALAGLEGGNADRFGRYYPVVYDGLVAVALLAVFVARHSPWWVRWVRWLVLLALVAGGIAASVQHALDGFEPVRGTALEAGVASAPWVAALLAIWLWVSMFRQLRDGAQRRAGRRSGRHRPSSTRKADDTPEPIPGPAAENRDEDRPEQQTDPLPLPTAEDLPEAYREPAEPEPEPDPGPWDTPWPDGAREARQALPEPPEEEERPVRPSPTLPTDVKLVGRPEKKPAPEPDEPDEEAPAATTVPEFPLPGRPEPEEARAQEDGTEDGEETLEDWATYSPERNPPSGTLRSGPVPPEKG